MLNSLLLITASWLAAVVPEVDTVVVCPREFQEALEPWVAMRQEQGRVIRFVDNRQSADEIREEIRQLALRHPVRWVLLVGDARPELPGLPSGVTVGTGVSNRLTTTTPTHYQPAKIISRWGPDRSIATDTPYADLNGDGLPNLAVGRLTADSAEELAVMVQKIVAYETARPEGNWRQQLNFVAGVGGFGALVDSVLEYTTKRFLTEGIPGAYRTTMTYGSWRSPFSPDPRRFHEVAIDRLNEGCLFWVYLGHGQQRQLDRVQVPGGAYHILGVQDMAKLRPVEPPPIAMFLACYTGAFDQPDDCLAEELLRAPGGPVAVLAGSRVTMPYAMAVLGSAMLHEYFHERQPTLGELVQHAKQSLGQDLETADGTFDQQGSENFSGTEGDARSESTAGSQTSADSTDSAHVEVKAPSAARTSGPAMHRQLLDALAVALSPHRDELHVERREHVALFNLLGDPLLTLRHPEKLEVVTEPRTTAGNRLQVTLRSNVQGRGTLELVSRRDQPKNSPAARRQFRFEESSLTAMQEEYHRANDQRWLAADIELNGGETEFEITIPEQVRGPCYLRCYVTGTSEDALGAAPIFIHPMTSAP